MSECKHGLKHGCFYCHNRTTTTTAISQPAPKRRTKATRLSEQMNDRMTTLKRRLRKIRGE
jgi:pyruvate-formate lyase-activating enzyme